MRRFIIALAPVAAMCATLTMSTGSASASVSVVTAIRSQDKAVNESSALKALKGIDASKPGDAKKLIKPIETLAKKFDHAATVVADSTVDSSTQRLARKDWSTGVREFATGFYTLGRALRDVSDGNSAQAVSLVTKADKGIKAGEKLGDKADRLLGITTGA
jgi:hypothetical protein